METRWEWHTKKLLRRIKLWESVENRSIVSNGLEIKEKTYFVNMLRSGFAWWFYWIYFKKGSCATSNKSVLNYLLMSMLRESSVLNFLTSAGGVLPRSGFISSIFAVFREAFIFTISTLLKTTNNLLKTTSIIKGDVSGIPYGCYPRHRMKGTLLMQRPPTTIWEPPLALPRLSMICFWVRFQLSISRKYSFAEDRKGW